MQANRLPIHIASAQGEGSNGEESVFFWRWSCCISNKKDKMIYKQTFYLTLVWPLSLDLKFKYINSAIKYILNGI